jgi:hypothetical protein
MIADESRTRLELLLALRDANYSVRFGGWLQTRFAFPYAEPAFGPPLGKVNPSAP